MRFFVWKLCINKLTNYIIQQLENTEKVSDVLSQIHQMLIDFQNYLMYTLRNKHYKRLATASTL